ncbi:hypothetical protein CP02DC18_1219, partial [Chlamydia psittaci 02DC18]
MSRSKPVSAGQNRIEAVKIGLNRSGLVCAGQNRLRSVKTG